MIFADTTGRVVLLDGGMGSTIEDRGVSVRNALWGSSALLTSEGLFLNDRIHREFREAGADVLTANVHNASQEACNAYDPTDDGLFERVNAAAVASARRAADGDCLVAAGIGSAEGAYAEESSHEVEEIVAMLRPQADLLRRLAVDLTIFETLTTENEIRAVAELAAPPFAAGLTCGADGRTLAGVTVEAAVEILLPAKPEAIFIQCTRFDYVAKALPALVDRVEGVAAAGVYANDGRVWTDMRWHGDRVSPEDYAAAALGWRDLGARIIGGCCGTGPEHIAALRTALAEDTEPGTFRQ